MQDGDVELRDLSEVFAAHGVASCVATSPRAAGSCTPRTSRAGSALVDARLRWIEFRPVVADNGGAGGTFAPEPRDLSL